ncbi:MAG: PIN domain-containing protein [Bacteroidales bacterium]|jgi:predicted nucleic acid-binding protein|nr:PIN domain-containing protein [Bacteroidales bacterium]
MIKIIVDTNIVFSALLNINSRIGQILINGKTYFDFYSPEYVKSEIFQHKGKIKSIGKLSDDEFVEAYGLILKNITILNHSLIPLEIYRSSELLCQDIDIDDTIFSAVSDFVKGTLWTGDLKLLNGLKNKGYRNVIKTEELYQELLIRQYQK